jgi:hypothetical protein
MVILSKIVLSQTEPPWTSALWLKPTEGGIGFYVWLEGRWQILRPMNDMKTSNPYDDQPYDLSGQGSTPGPNTVGTEQIMDGAVEMEDLHDDVKGKIQKTYDVSDESLFMDFDIQP